MKMVTKLSVVLGLIATLVLSGCQKTETHEEMRKYAATTPFREDTSILEPYVCQIRAIRHIEVRSLEKGYLTHIFIDEGQWVKKGEPMFKIMPNVYQAELLTAEAEAQNMNIEYLNTKALADKNIVSVNELALAKAKLDKANAAGEAWRKPTWGSPISEHLLMGLRIIWLLGSAAFWMKMIC